MIRYLFADQSEVPEGDGWLAVSEADFQSGLRIPQRRADWRLGRWAAKRALAAWIGHDLAGDRIAVHPAPDGAPEILVDDFPAGVAISFSHRAGRALCALAPEGTRFGCDLELIEPRSDAFIEDYFTAVERRMVAGCPPADRPLLANLLWSAKESALKALRTGLRMDTRSVEIDLGNESLEGADWQPLRAQLVETGEVLEGWWQRDGGSLLTVSASPSGPAPIPFPRRDEAVTSPG